MIDNVRSSPSPQSRFFDAEAQALLTPRNPYAASVIMFIESRLRQFKLNSRYEPYEILSEAYLRGQRFVQAGRPINSPIAWMKVTALHIIYELSRKDVRVLLADFNLERSALRADSAVERLVERLVEREEIDTRLESLHLSLCLLSPADIKLLNLRWVENLSWRAVQERLQAEGEPVCSETALRQRGHRALTRLRQLFHRTLANLLEPAS